MLLYVKHLVDFSKAPQIQRDIAVIGAILGALYFIMDG